MIVVFSGLPGAGKSLKLARTAIGLLYRNRALYGKAMTKWQKDILKNPSLKEPQPRILYTNLKFSNEVHDEFDGFIEYWTAIADLLKFRDCDVLIDEIATYFDATQWQNMSLEVKRWLQQHRKFGVEIYGTAQDFAQADKSFRRLTSNLVYLTKIVGSRDISATKPNPKYVWGFVLVQTLDPVRYDEEKSKFQGLGAFPQFMWIRRDDVKVFDTRAEVKAGGYPPLRHIERDCELSDCPHHKVLHV